MTVTSTGATEQNAVRGGIRHVSDITPIQSDSIIALDWAENRIAQHPSSRENWTISRQNQNNGSTEFFSQTLTHWVNGDDSFLREKQNAPSYLAP